MKGKGLLPTHYLLISILAMVALRFLFPVMKIILSPWHLFGIVPLVLGVAINIIADKAFHEANTAVKPFEESTVLITNGVFRVSRNPMYLGFVLILIGIAILVRALTPYVIIPIFAVLMDKIFIEVEERMLAEQFGVEWLQYEEKTRRWI